MDQYNELLRSAHEIAKRKGEDTNWDVFERNVRQALLKQAGVPNTVDEQIILRATVTPRTFRFIKDVPIDGKKKFEQFLPSYLEWARKTFPSGTKESGAKHLIREAVELSDSLNPEEAADCFMLLLFICDKMGWDILAEAEKKLQINQSRQWESPNQEGWQHHKS